MRKKNKKLLQPPCRILAGPLQPPLNLARLERGMQRIFEKIIIMDENDALSEYNKIPLVTIVPVVPFTLKST